ncbi:NADPH-dependent FMN reductase [Variovorax sp. J2P1-59]|uniref:NADPH-dependent FMN reductase n=1 Tax=Variovorax flavidus TaxID=3053501 RepID=UPI002576AE6E|nr:NADPH-dependent FMN reductase [Variovorax sp. J2P1-59]MDM0073402.1 NADPH-dependent FMN reductase [Variovorax sp. J2P1-59]
MTLPRKVGVIVGSNRRESINRKLARAIVKLGSPTLRFEDIRIDDLPMYNGDLEGSRPDTVNRFTAAVVACDAVLIVMPEHNRSLPALLKNAIDWGSKPSDRNVWRDKPAAITGTSPGAIGTAVGQQHLRQILGILGATVMGGEAYVSFKPDLLDAEGHIANESTRAFLQAFVDRFAALVGKLASDPHAT